MTRVKLELDSETFGRLVQLAVTEKRPADWQAEVILRQALGTWPDSRADCEREMTISRAPLETARATA